jgi:GNAT superfamily N-acetyltransferase
MKILLRKGVKKDLPQVLELIKELAEYERVPLEVSNTLEDMERDGFGNKPVFEFLVAMDGEKIVGTAIYYFAYSTWKGKSIYLEDLIVTASYRRKGIGASLFAEMIRIAKKENAARLSWQVLDWNEPAINFYKKYQTEFDPEWINCKLVYDQIQKFKD